MDIGSMQRVIIVEPDRLEIPSKEPASVETARSDHEFGEEWPLPIEIEAAYEPS